MVQLCGTSKVLIITIDIKTPTLNYLNLVSNKYFNISAATFSISISKQKPIHINSK